MSEFQSTEYKLLYGKRRNKKKSPQLLFLLSEKCLFVQNNDRNGKKEYQCYQRILIANKKNDSDKGNLHALMACKARASVTTDGICYRNHTNHTQHATHEKIFSTLEKMNEIKDVCETVGAHLPTHKISTKHIFYAETA